MYIDIYYWILVFLLISPNLLLIHSCCVTVANLGSGGLPPPPHRNA